MNEIIKIENLSKKYIITQSTSQYHTIVETLSSARKKWKRRIGSWITGKTYRSPPTSKDFWALSSLNLSILEGDKVGIIGKNGAGKSTLLKLLARITTPSIGKIKIKGKVASLLEVGTGFHPELTGRENIMLNGAILGMKKAEIRSKLDEIISFSEVEEFLDTPVKFYSSGMYAKLGFAIAANVRPDVLVIDEVLAVGDVPFQNKCLDKMRKLNEEGATIIFVSHNMELLTRFCSTGIYLRDGKLVKHGPIAECAKLYGLNNKLI